jgi:hypothetical protein
LIAADIPDDISRNLPRISGLMMDDKSVIVRDYSTDIIANYAGAGKTEAEKSFPLLKEMLYKYEGKHAGHALKGLLNVVRMLPEYKNIVAEITEQFTIHKKAVVSKAAKSLLKYIRTEC